MGKSIGGMKDLIKRNSTAKAEEPKEEAAPKDEADASSVVSQEDAPADEPKPKRPRSSPPSPPPEIDVDGATGVEVSARIVEAMRAHARGTYDAAALASELCRTAAEKSEAFAAYLETYQGDDAAGDDLRNRSRVEDSPPKLSELVDGELTGTLVVPEASEPYFSELRLAYREDGALPAFHKLERLNYLAFDGEQIRLSANGTPPVTHDADTGEGFSVIGLLDAIAKTIAKQVPSAATVSFKEIAENSHLDGVWDLKFSVQ